MLRRCALELSSSGRSAWRRQGPVSAQTPFFLYARSSLSSASRPPQTPPSAAKLSKPPPGQPSPAQGPASQNASGSGSFLPKLLLGGIVVGAAVIAAHEAGYVDLGRSHAKNESTPIETSKQDAIRDLNDAEHAEDRGVHLEKEPTGLTPAANEDADETVNSVNIEEPDTGTETTSSEETYSQERSPKAEEQQQPSVIQNDPSSPDQQVSDSETPFEDTMDLNNGVKQMGVSSEENQEIPFDNKVEISIHDDVPAPEETTQNDSAGYETEPESLAGSYSLQDEVRPETSSYKETSTSISAKEAPVVDIESSKSKDKPSDDKIVLDFIEAIHVAEKRQAEFDFRTFEEEKRMLKEKYEKELRDARARELMYAEEAAILDKELNKERAKAATTVKLLQEKAEENLRSELQRKEEDAEMQLQKIKEIAKAELNAAIASEKSSQMEKIAEANLHINALCMAFYARSEEARQSHSVHKLALGALALEDALSKGLPIRAEIEDLHASLVDIKSDSFLDLVLSSLPEETLYHGTNTRFQLNQKFDALKGTLRHFSLIPPGGGGILTHAVAHVASFVKVKENDMSGDGIESVISRVENLLAEGKLSEAADALEGGVCETEAAGTVRDWVRQARNRAIAEQAIALIQSYATSISLT